MHTKQNKTTAIIRRPKQFSIRLFFTAMIFFLYFLPINISVLAQNFSQEISPCYESAQARYACFIQARKGEFERAKEIEAFRRSVREKKEELHLESLQLSKKQFEKNQKEIMKQIKYSRSRNISHKGEKYSLTYGYVVEVKP